jgi:chemotaxis protein MotA
MKFSISTVIVVVLSLGLLFVGIADVIGVFHFKKLFPILNFSRYFDIPSLFIVFGGLLTNSSIMFSPKVVAQAFKKVGFVFSHSEYNEQKKLEAIKEVTTWVVPFNQDRVKFLNEVVEKYKNTTQGYLFQLVSANYPKEEIVEIADKYIHQNFVQEKKLSEVFKNMGNSGPAFGMFGTLFGLVYMLSSMDDPSKIGPGLALGLLVTLYGVSFTHLLFYPLSKKLHLAAEKEKQVEEIYLSGIYLILEKKSEFFINDALKAEIDRKYLAKHDKKN